MHKDAVENAVYAMKYQNRRIYGQTFGKEMAEHFSFLSMGKKDHLDRAGSASLHSREKKAGFNQAEIVAKGIIKKIPELPWMQVLLKRIKATSPPERAGR